MVFALRVRGLPQKERRCEVKIVRFTAASAGAVVLAMIAGCAQNIVYREFYEPNDKTSLKRDDGTTVGAVKAEATKNGAPNWSDNKTLSISVLGL